MRKKNLVVLELFCAALALYAPLAAEPLERALKSVRMPTAAGAWIKSAFIIQDDLIPKATPADIGMPDRVLPNIPPVRSFPGR